MSSTLQGAAEAGRRSLAAPVRWNLRKLWACSAEELRARESVGLRTVFRKARDLDGYRTVRDDLISVESGRDARTVLDGLPVLEKSDLRGREWAYQRRLPGLDATTSGTTGTPLALRRSVYSVLVEEAWISHHRGWAGYHSGDPIAVMRGEVVAATPGDPVQRFVPARRTLLLSSYHLSESTVAGYLDALRRHRVRWLAAYPSSIASLTALALARGLSLPPLSAVFTSSETLAPQTRAAIESAWVCRIWDHYGHAERTVAAMECEARRYHLLPGYGVVEPVEDGLLTTNLTNGLMPLLRYRVTDAVEGWSDVRCVCGRGGRHFATVTGRTEDVLIGEDGRRIGRLDHVFKGVGGVLAGQICQEADGSVEVRVVPSGVPADPAGLVELLRGRTVERIGAVPLRVEIVSELERAVGGKTPFILQRLSGQGPRTVPVGDADS